MPLTHSTGAFRFGVYEIDTRAGELRKQGMKLKVGGQPLEVLALLLERPGEVVTREELRERLWPGDTFVDFDQGLNKAINKLRDALGDSAETPRYIETLPRRGYRFLADVERIGEERPVPPTVATAPASARNRRIIVLATLCGVALIAAGILAASIWTKKAAPAIPPIHSLAVLPLENLTGDASQEYFVDGMTDALTTDLAQIGNLRVISRTSATRYKGVRKPVAEIGKELDVDAVVEGSVMRSGNHVRIDTQLIYAPADRHLWSKSYERNLSDVVALQSDVASAVAGELAVQFTPQQRERLRKASSVNLDAYDAYLRGRYFWNKRTKEALSKSGEYYQEAINRDPNYVLAYAGLADTLMLQGYSVGGSGNYHEAGAKAKAAALRAVTLDDTSAEAHAALGFIEYRHEWDFASAERELRRAIDLNPGYATAHHWYSIYLQTMGRRDEAFQQIKIAQQLDPVSPSVAGMLGTLSAKAGRLDEALRQDVKALELEPSQFNTHVRLTSLYIQMGRFAEAQSEIATEESLSPGSRMALIQKGLLYAKTGRTLQAEEIVKELNSSGKRGEIASTAMIELVLGRKDEGLQLLEKCYQQRDPGLLAYDEWAFNPVRDDPRFQAILRDVGIPENAILRKPSR